MRVLGIETSCDETGVAVYDSEQGLLAQALHSQIARHAEYGGVVPELASRDHLAKLAPMVDQVLEAADTPAEALDAIETDLRSASRLKAMLAEPLLSVAGAQVREVLGQSADRMTAAQWRILLSEVIASLSSALNQWDPWSVGRPAGAVGVSVARTTTRWLSDQPGLASDPGGAARAPQLDVPIEPWQLRLDPWQSWLEPPPVDLAHLKPEQALLLAKRFGLGEQPTTARSLAQELGITTSTAESRSRRSLREALIDPFKK